MRCVDRLSPPSEADKTIASLLLVVMKGYAMANVGT
jgi:hypothetical protein